MTTWCKETHHYTSPSPTLIPCRPAPPVSHEFESLMYCDLWETCRLSWPFLQTKPRCLISITIFDEHYTALLCRPPFMSPAVVNEQKNTLWRENSRFKPYCLLHFSCSRHNCLRYLADLFLLGTTTPWLILLYPGGPCDSLCRTRSCFCYKCYRHSLNSTLKEYQTSCLLVL